MAKDGYIYFIGAYLNGETLHIKIGKANEPSSRLSQLSTGTSLDLDIIAAFKVSDVFEAEGRLHKLLDHKRINPRKEWFYKLSRGELALTLQVLKHHGAKPSIAQVKSLKRDALESLIRDLFIPEKVGLEDVQRLISDKSGDKSNRRNKRSKY